MSSLNIALCELFDTHVLVYTFNSAITLSFLLLHLSFMPRESVHVSYMTAKSSCSIFKVKKLPWIIFVSCSLFKDIYLFLLFILIPSLSYLISLVSTFLYPVSSHSCDPLEDLLPSSSQHGFSSVFLEDEDLEF